MKIFFCLLLTASASFAATKMTRRYDYPVINGLPIDNACATSSTFRSLKPQQYCTSSKEIRYACHLGETETCRLLKNGESARTSESIRTEVTCTKSISKNIEVSRYEDKKVCTRNAPINEGHYGECLAWGQKRTFAGLNYYVNVLETQGSWSRYVTEPFTIPSCH